MRVHLALYSAGAKASFQLSLSAVAEVAHAAEWNCTMQLDALDQQIHGDLEAFQASLRNEIES